MQKAPERRSRKGEDTIEDMLSEHSVAQYLSGAVRLPEVP